MEIISHRGYWKAENEKNSLIAFARSFENKWGTELDLRHFEGQLVVSHDAADKNSVLFEEVLSLYEKAGCFSTLALNIKEDGLQSLINPFLPRLNNYFLFDMSIPDMRASLNRGLRCFARYSDVETIPVYEERAEGLWVDAFEREWIDRSVLDKLASRADRVCFVSPELHRHDHLPFWNSLTHLDHIDNFILCTDLPQDAANYFGSSK